MEADWTKIHQVTSEAKFVQGKFDKALEVDETSSESIVLSDMLVQNTIFSISVWIIVCASANRTGHIVSNIQDFPRTGWLLQVSPSIIMRYRFRFLSR